jgi:hypothetical protein
MRAWCRRPIRNQTLAGLEPLQERGLLAADDAAKMHWIGQPLGSAVVSTVFHTAPIKNWREARETAAIMGAPGTTAPDAITARLINATLGTKFTLVTGYKGGP